MADKKIIAVVDATGAQGGGLVCAIRSPRSGSTRAMCISRGMADWFPENPRQDDLARRAQFRNSGRD